MDSGHGMRECGGGVATEKPVRFLWRCGESVLDLSTSLPLFGATTVTPDFELKRQLSVKSYNLLTRFTAIDGVTNLWLDKHSLTAHVSPWAGSDAAERDRIMSEMIAALQDHYGFGSYTMGVAPPKPTGSERDRQNLARMVEAAKPIVAYYFATDSPDDGEDAPRLDRSHIKALADAFAACVGDGR